MMRQREKIVSWWHPRILQWTEQQPPLPPTYPPPTPPGHIYQPITDQRGGAILEHKYPRNGIFGLLFVKIKVGGKWAFPCFWEGLNACPDNLGHFT